MTPEALEAELRRAADYEACTHALARYFVEGRIFCGHGADNAEDEAFWLLRHLQGWRDGAWDEPPDPSLLGEAARLAGRRVAERRPLAYLLGEAWFAGLAFHVDQSVLIPRSPLAEVIERCFAPWARIAPGDRLLDVGTGSGCLAVAAARYCDDALVDATEISPAALEIAARNIARHRVEPRVQLHRADLFPDTPARYRVIMSNPPYVPHRVLAALPPEYHHEPAVALDGGESGLEPVERLMRGAAPRLTPDGVLVAEVGAEANALAEAHPRLPVTWLELEHGGEGVFVATAEQLVDYFGGAERPAGEA